VVGFDDFKLADMLATPVTVVTSDTEELGRHAAHLLLDRINGDDAPSRRTVLPVHLIARGTGEIAHP
jgi:LacI family transcriptional regulator